MRWTSISRTLYTWLLLAGLFSCLPLASYAQANQGLVPDSTEARVLHQLYLSTGGDQWAYRTNWPTSSTWPATVTSADFGTWAGVGVTNGDITSLDRNVANLKGTLPNSLGLLTGLTYLNIPNNPGLTGELPASLGQLIHLSYLRTTNASLGGELPAALGQLTQLQYLYLESNLFSGPLPAWLGNLTNLRALSLVTNRFTGPIPAAWQSLTNLQDLELSNGVGIRPGEGNALTGGIPAWLGNLTNLTFLDLSLNPLGGTIPPQLGNLTNLTFLELDGCRLTGAVPSQVLQLPQLRTLLLGYNAYPYYPDRNAFTTLPAPNLMPNLGSLAVLLQNNQFEFGTLEPYFTGPGQLVIASSSVYAPQMLPQDAQTVTAETGQATSLSSAIGGSHTHYQWQRQVGGNWLNLSGNGATTANYALAAAQLADAGSYRCRATNDFVTNLTLTTRTYVLDVRERGARNLPNDQNTGLALAHPPLPADSTAAKPVDMNYVRTWIPRVPLTQATPDPVAAAQAQAVTTATQAVPGSLLYEHWANVYGPADLDQLPISSPATTQALTSFEAPSGLGNDYGARLRGYLLPPVTGTYSFWLSGDDVAQLWLSSDASPAHTALIASLPGYTNAREWTKFPEQHSVAISLVAGQRYYVEVLHRQGGGGDGVAVAWSLPGQTTPSTDPIAGQYLAPAPVTAPPMSLNLVVNPSFDADYQAAAAPTGWLVAPGANTGPNASYSETYAGGHTGALHGTHYRPDPYEVYTYQTLMGLASGTYTLRAWVRSNDGNSQSKLRARNYGGANREVACPLGTTDWVQIEIPNLAVTNGQCELGIYSNATAGQVLFFDDVAFTRQDLVAPQVPTQAIALANPGFEADGQATATPQGWLVTPGDSTYANASYSETYPGAHAGSYHGTHYRPDRYEVYTYQTVTGLANGTYTLRAWVRSNDGNSQSKLRARNYGGPDREVGLAAGVSAWTSVELPGLAVTNGQLELGVYSHAAAGQALYFDDFTLERQLTDPTDSTTAAPTWTVDQAQTSTQYLDGLGRPVQTVLHQASPHKLDMVQPQAYDALDREPRQYLPFADSTHDEPGHYRHRALTQQQQFYGRTTPPNGGLGPLSPRDPIQGVARTGVAYAETQFEPSPLNRVLAQGAAGEAWQLNAGHAPQRLERTNTAADSVLRFVPSYDPHSGDPGYQGLYADGELWATQVTDEQGHRSLEWKDKEGQVILRQVEAGTTGTGSNTVLHWLRTAYAYDDFNHLRFVLQPEGTRRMLATGTRPAALPASAQPFVFHYRYDERGRQIAKQVPGQDGETVAVYDQLDRPVLSQDAQQRTRREWNWTKYDALGRTVLSGLVTRTDTAGQVTLQAQAASDTLTAHQYEQRSGDYNAYPQHYTTSQAFPQLGQNGFGPGLVLSATYYDDYDFDGNGVADAQYDTQLDSYFASGSAPVADAQRTTGLVTGTQTRVLANDQLQQPWLTTVTFYDERARAVQVQTLTARKDPQGEPLRDLLTTQLDFTGKVVQSVARHEGLNHDPVVVQEFFTYDHTGRVLATRQQLPGEVRATRLDSVQYNEIGQAVRKTLGTGRLTQEVDYAYNIRGWLTKLNDPHQPVAADLFNLSLHYETGFSSGYEQYNGNLTGQTWRGRDGVQRAYGYAYDPVNRLVQGDFVARAGGSAGTLTTATAWNQEQDNYGLAALRYDDNGNILGLRRRGLLQNATHLQAKRYGAVDELSYAYVGNRLQAVDDAVTGNQLAKLASYHGAPTSLAGDFQEAGVRLSQEYLYDANGNLTQDKNKGITSIAYNHLNLPRQIHFGQVGDSIVFRYTASGQKVAKLVYQTGKPVLRTDYLGPYQYEQDSLRFFPHAEGRVLRFVSKDPAGQAHIAYQREYTFKDHLGNLRLAYRLGQTRTYSATLEQDSTTHKRETQQFDSLSVSIPVAQPVGTGLARTGSYVALLNAGGTSPQPIGPLTQLTVQKGDTLRVSAPGRYLQSVTNNSFAFSLVSFVASLLQPAQVGTPAGVDGSKRGGLPLLQVGLNAGSLTALTQLSNGVPKGYLRVLIFNSDSVLVDQRTVQLTQAALTGYEVLQTGFVPIQQDGYVTVYVGNESAVDVLFDDVQVEYRQGLLVQETQYDPWGLSLTGIDYATPGIQGLNKYQYNGYEYQSDLGLNLTDYGARLYDNQLGRWHNVDPLADQMRRHSPYNYGFDNPIRFVDHDGMGPGEGDNKPGLWTRFTQGVSDFFSKVTSSFTLELNRELNPSPEKIKEMHMITLMLMASSAQSEMQDLGSTVGGTMTMSPSAGGGNLGLELLGLEALGAAEAAPAAQAGSVATTATPAATAAAPATISGSNQTPISLDQALQEGVNFMQPGVPQRMIVQPSGIQAIQTYPGANGSVITKRVGIDINPASPHVQQLGPHLNLQTQVNGKIQGGTLADPHTPIDPRTITPGDICTP